MSVLGAIFFSESRLIILGTYKGYYYHQKDVDITNEELEKEIQKKLSDYVIVEDRQIVQEGYLAVIDYSTFIDEEKVSYKENQGAIIGSGFWGKDFEDELIGKKVGNEYIIECSYPMDYEDFALAGKEYRFEVFISKAKEYIFPVLNDDFVNEQLGYNSKDDFINETKMELQIKKAELKKEEYIIMVFDDLISKSKFYINENDVINRYKDLIDYYETIASYQEMDIYTYAYNVMHMSKDEFIDYCKQESIYYIKSYLVATRISNIENICIENNDIAEYCYKKNVFYEGDTPDDYLLNLIMIDKVQNYIVNMAN
ncbi:MAG: hypothetical protein IJT38_06470 [Clostridia bacterium]|nr:hypothetical protein [Clostridia bacterium]